MEIGKQRGTAKVSVAGATLIDANAIWRDLQRSAGAPALMSDGNHPTLFGSYVEALAIYREVSRRPLRPGLWRPAAVPPTAALEAARAVERVVSGGAI